MIAKCVGRRIGPQQRLRQCGLQSNAARSGSQWSIKLHFQYWAERVSLDLGRTKPFSPGCPTSPRRTSRTPKLVVDETSVGFWFELCLCGACVSQRVQQPAIALTWRAGDRTLLSDGDIRRQHSLCWTCTNYRCRQYTERARAR